MYYSVEAISDGLAQLAADDGGRLQVAAGQLPPGTALGDVVQREGCGFLPAPEETQRRKAHVQALLEKLLHREADGEKE